MSVHALAKSDTHTFSKNPVQSFTLFAGLGIDGDCHSGKTVKHRSRLHVKPPPPNLRQVHLISKEILDQFDVGPGEIGENVTTLGIDLLALGTGTKLHFVTDQEEAADRMDHPIVVVQGLRNPCPQINKFRSGLLESFIERDENRAIVRRKAGVMGTVEVGGSVSVGMKIVVERPDEFEDLKCV
jgi:hypothetical protein